jgi:hypothetical protein
MKLSKPFYSNCVMGYMHLYMRGNIKEALLCRGGNWLVPYHVVAFSKQKRAIHFRSIRHHRDNRWSSWWHEGNWEVIPTEKIETELLSQKRAILKRGSPHLIMARCVIAWLITLPFYMIGFGLFPIVNAWRSIVSTNRRRRRS